MLSPFSVKFNLYKYQVKAAKDKAKKTLAKARVKLLRAFKVMGALYIFGIFCSRCSFYLPIIYARKGMMKKELIAGFILIAAGISFAGDAAAFKDIGFSGDGKVYVFGQYGKTDVTYQPYAEIYTIDVEKNEYIPGGVYKNLEPNSLRSGSQVYEDLLAKHFLDLKKYSCKGAAADDVLYVLENEKKKGVDAIEFKNYGDNGESSRLTYSVRLVPTFYGRGKDLRSSFYIDLNVSDNDGNIVKSRKVGSPDIKRKGVSNYKIVRIFRDASKSGLVFVVEKTVEDSAGSSIRYMVETVKL